MIFFFVFSTSYVVTANDLLMSHQEHGEPKINASVGGNKLTINGKVFDDGIGTHAASMIPIDVPQTAISFTGSVGIDSEASNPAEVSCIIYSGSNALFSHVFASKNEDAVEFEVNIPVGTRKLYLFAGQTGGSNSNDHIDWVNLRFSYGNPKLLEPKVIYVTEYGVLPGIESDQGLKLRKAIDEARSAPGSTIYFPKGTYHFYHEGCLKFRICVTNHHQPSFRFICISLSDLHDITIEGSNSTFVFHNMTIGMLIMDSSNITLQNVHLDYSRLLHTEVQVVAKGDKYTTVFIDKKLYNYEIRNGKFVGIGEGFTDSPEVLNAFRNDTKMIVEMTADLFYSGNARETGKENYIDIEFDTSASKFRIGDYLVLRSYARPNPTVFNYRSINITFSNVDIYASYGMAFLNLRCENINFFGGGNKVAPNRYVSNAVADAVHFSTCRGQITVDHSIFEGMMDDAINVHSYCLEITKLINKTAFNAKFSHDQAVGFDLFHIGEKLRFIHTITLEIEDEEYLIQSIRRIDTNNLEIVIGSEIPSYVKLHDTIENANFYATLNFTNNIVRYNRARGALLNTPKKVIVENNLFNYTSGSAILLAGASTGWFATGECKDVLIKKNTFINSLTSKYQFTEAVIVSYPVITDVKPQTKFYHHNIRLIDNVFYGYDTPILYAISSENVEFIDNKIKDNGEFPSWGKKPFHFIKCRNVTIKYNYLAPEKEWTINDVDLEYTNSSEIHF